MVLFQFTDHSSSKTLEEIGDPSEKTVIDTTKLLDVDENFEHHHNIHFMKTGSTSESLQSSLPNAKVVEESSTMPALLLDKQSGGQMTLPVYFVARHHADAK